MVSASRAYGALRSQLLVGKVRHRRERLTTYDFGHSVWYLGLDLGELKEVGPWPLLAYERRALLEVRDRDHLGMAGAGLRASVATHLREAGLNPESLRVTLVTYPSVMGYVFNPVSFYLCHSHDGVLRHVVAEVSNTHGGREVYDFAPEDDGPVFRSTASKRMYVSPFIGLEARHDLTVAQSDRRLVVSIAEYESEGRTLSASVSLTPRALSTRNILVALARDPMVPVKTVLLIAWHAARLRWRGLKWHRYRTPAVPSAGPGAGRCS